MGRTSKIERGLVVALLTITTIAVFYSSFGRSGHNHFEMHMNAARHVVQGQIPYAKSLNDSQSGGLASWWLYSPTAAITYYPFSIFPAQWGLFLYLAVSVFLFVFGIYALLKSLGIAWDTVGLRWFYLPCFSELIGGLQSEKLEVSMVGLILYSAALLVRGRLVAGACLLALPTVLKIQPIAIGGLIVLAYFFDLPRWKKLIRFSLNYSVFIAIFLALPLGLMSYDFLLHSFAAWYQALDVAVRQTWHANTTTYMLLNSYLPRPMSYSQMRTVGLGIAGAFGLCVLFSRNPSTFSKIALAISLGSIYGVILSPLSQGSTFVFGTPALLFTALIYLKTKRGLPLILFHWIVSSIAWSDLSPWILTHIVASVKGRTWGFTALTVFLIYWLSYRKEPLFQGK